MLRKPVILLTLVAGSCVTIPRFRALEDRVAALEKRCVEIEEEQARDKERMQRLHRDLQEAEEALRATTAAQGADVEGVKGEIARLRGTDEELEYHLSRLREDLESVKKALEEKLGLVVVRLPPGVSNDPESLMKAGKAALERGDTRTARGLFQRLLDQTPDHALAPQAQYLMGESYMREGMYTQAIREYQRVHDRYRGQKDAPVGAALLRISECLLKRGECAKAREVLKYLIDFGKKVPEAQEAQKRLKELPKTCK